jgi:Porin PorA
MKRVVGLILLALGVMMLVLAPLLKFYVLPSAAKTPIDTYTESTSNVLFDQILIPSKVAAADPNPYDRGVEATQYVYVRGDVPAAEQPEAKSQDLAIFDYFQRVNRNDTGELVDSSTARYAFDRVSSELVNCCGASVNDEPVDMSGILPVKFPFDVQQQEYQIFDSTLKTSVPVAFQGEEEKFGINTYVFKSVVEPTKVGTLEVPTAALPGAKKSVTGNTILTENYGFTTTYWVDPVTGQIVAGESVVDNTLDRPTGIGPGLVKAKYTGTTGNQESADDIAALASQVTLLGSTLPLVLGVLGIVLLVVGLLMLRGGKQDSGSGGSDEDLVPAGNAPSSSTATQVLDDATKKPDSA